MKQILFEFSVLQEQVLVPSDSLPGNFLFENLRFVSEAEVEVRRSFITTTVRDQSPATGRVRTGDQRFPALCHCQLGDDIPALPGTYVRAFSGARNGPELDGFFAFENHAHGSLLLVSICLSCSASNLTIKMRFRIHFGMIFADACPKLVHLVAWICSRQSK